MLDRMSDSIQGSRIENLHSREVDRQSPTGLILYYYYSIWKLIQVIYHPTEGRRLSWPRHCRKDVHSPYPRLQITVVFTIDAAQFDPRTSCTADKHATTRPLQPVLIVSSLPLLVEHCEQHLAVLKVFLIRPVGNLQPHLTHGGCNKVRCQPCGR